MSMPDKKTLTRMRKKLEKESGFQMLDPEANELEKFRFKICQELLKVAQKKKINASQMANDLGITKADMSRVFNHRIERMSTDKLLKLYLQANPNCKLKVS